jgi:subtilase family serine protease
MEDPAAALTHAVFGLDNLEYQHPLRARGAPKHPSPGIAERNSDSDHGFFTSNCFTGVKTETYSTSTSYPIATYEGNVYTNNIFGCGYTPQEIQTAYDLTELYSEGFDGTGQTIAIIDWCGSPTIRADANAFSKRFGLPPLTPSNFHILNSSTPAKCAAPDVEINIDVEWAHAIAPGAHIALVIAPSSSLNDVDTAELYAIANGLGNVISGSYGSEELLTSPAALDEANLINETAALLGISANFASGDNGDFTADNPANSSSVFAPADSPYATAVGGISLALNSDNTVAWQTGWGTNVNTLVSNGSISDPPTEGFFYQGSGGGPSAVFSKPSFQNNLHGKQRLLPDISWLADPYTGGVIAISEPAVYPPVEWQVWGGTSLATPMFSALWAIANQVAGLPLGQAARYLYSMPADTITDVVPVGSANNVSATIQESPSLIDTYSAAQLAAPLESTTTLYSALLNPPLYPGDIFVLTFGTDTGLETTVGWDDVTGLGTPNGKAFADFFKP